MKTIIILAAGIASFSTNLLVAQAQQEPSELLDEGSTAEGRTGKPSPESPGARAIGVSVAEASDAQKQEAQEAFAEGDRAFDVQDYEIALKSFELSYSIVASPNSRLMIARALRELGRLDETFEEYGGVIRDAGDREEYQTTAETADKEREALRSRLAWVTIEWSGLIDGATLEVAGRNRSLEDAQEGIFVVPGRTQINAVSPGGEEASAVVHLAAGRSAEVQLSTGKTVTIGAPPETEEQEAPSKVEVERSEEETNATRRSLLPYAYASTGVGILGMATFATFAVLSGNRFRTLEEDCSDWTCPPESQKDIDKGAQQQLVANIGLGVGIAGIGTGVLLYVLDVKQRGPVRVDVGAHSFAVQGEF